MQPLAQVDFLDEQIDTLSADILRRLGELEAEALPPLTADVAGITGERGSAGNREGPRPPMPFAQAIAVLDTISGVDQRGAEWLIAEWGTDRQRFGTARRLAAWTRVASGNNESAGTQRSGKSRRAIARCGPV